MWPICALLVGAIVWQGAPMRLESPAFTHNQPLPLAFTGYGDFKSPPRAWSGAPKGTREFALIVDDPDVPLTSSASSSGRSRSAVAFCLLVIAALMARTVWHLSHLDLGFDPEGVRTANVTLHEGTYPSLTERRQPFDRILQRLREAPDVTAAGLTSWLPFRIGPSMWIEAEGSGDAQPIRASVRPVTPGYFDAHCVDYYRPRRSEASGQLVILTTTTV